MIRAFAQGPFTGRHITAILVAFFGVVMAVNFTMAYLAKRSFSGVMVDNSYVASQHFNQWLDEAAREKALGWDARVERHGANRLAIRLTGAPAGAQVMVEARHPLGHRAPVALTFREQADSLYLSDQALAPGRWKLRVEVSANGRKWRSERDFR